MTTLLIVGGLTVDRFADGSSAPGGSVLHAGLAADAEGAEVRVLTIAGAEAEAQDGLRRLAALGTCISQSSPTSTIYRHREADGHRVLVFEAGSDAIDPQQVTQLGPVDAVLVAPIADELAPTSIAPLREASRAPLAVVLIQGWLRRLRIGTAVEPMRLPELRATAWSAFNTADAVVVSTEDFVTDDHDPFQQIAAVRKALGPAPLLVLTLGADGYLLDDPAADRVIASVPRNVVDGVPAVGAGDTFGAALATHLSAGDAPADAAHAAAERVIAMLESRRL